MGVNTPHALGNFTQTHVEAETTFGTLVKATAGGAMKVTNPGVWKKTKPRGPRQYSNSQSRSNANSIRTGIETTEWTFEQEIQPSGVAGTLPDAHPLLLRWLPNFDQPGGTSVTYEPGGPSAAAYAQGDVGSMSITRLATDVYMEAVVGAWGEELRLSGSSGDVPKLSTSGGAKDLITTGYTLLMNATTPGTPTTFDVDDPDQLQVGSVVAFDADDNGGAGYEVTVKNAAGPAQFSVAENVAAADNAPVRPFAPTPTYEAAGDAIEGVCGALDIDSKTDFELVSWEVMLKNNITGHDDVALQKTVPDFTEGRFMVSGTLVFKARRDVFEPLYSSWISDPSTRYDISLQAGVDAGYILTIDMDRCEWDDVSFEYPEASEGDSVATITVNFTSYSSADNADDNITLTFT